MGAKSQIEWCDSTLNFFSGCTKVSPGCMNCYAEGLSFRNLGPRGRGGALGKWGPGAERKLHERAFKEAFRLNRKPWVCDECGACVRDRSVNSAHYPCKSEHTCPSQSFSRRRIFSLSLGDWLDPDIPAAWLARMLDTIRQCQDVRWLLLTKRPELWLSTMRRCLRYAEANDFKWAHDGCSTIPFRGWLADWCVLGRAPSNILIGTSVEDQQRADWRIPALLRIPAAGRFLSLEPLLGPVDLNRMPTGTRFGGGWALAVGLHWIIVGGESGPKARPCHVEWIRSLVRQGRDAGVPVFVKQLGQRLIDRNDRGFEGDSGPSGWPMDTATADDVEPGVYQGKPVRVRLCDSKGGNPAEWPDDLRVREFPEVLS